MRGLCVTPAVWFSSRIDGFRTVSRSLPTSHFRIVDNDDAHSARSTRERLCTDISRFYLAGDGIAASLVPRQCDYCARSTVTRLFRRTRAAFRELEARCSAVMATRLDDSFDDAASFLFNRAASPRSLDRLQILYIPLSMYSARRDRCFAVSRYNPDDVTGVSMSPLRGDAPNVSTEYHLTSCRRGLRPGDNTPTAVRSLSSRLCVSRCTSQQRGRKELAGRWQKIKIVNARRDQGDRLFHEENHFSKGTDIMEDVRRNRGRDFSSLVQSNFESTPAIRG